MCLQHIYCVLLHGTILFKSARVYMYVFMSVCLLRLITYEEFYEIIFSFMKLAMNDPTKVTPLTLPIT